ncbi:CYFA0S05e01266g1_1 [Cyberlindnera fabianii]|uniref:CYFA0S05e01266g1_1 n=1 Tax=Cyberlindnera fabianii TaxID=36022 RepID=A0A061ASJ0_CYBFA|nr:CYFA0S05e01266g1_1 [Cyberlindnera fabianii]
MPISHEFRFSTTSAAVQRSDVHPIELVVQSVLGDSLDALATQLQTLHESQVVLMARLKVIEEKLKRWEVETEQDVDIKKMHDRLVESKKRLTTVLAKLSEIEQRTKKQATETKPKDVV